MSEEIGFHPLAVERTSDEARAGRDEVDRIAVADPAGFRSGFFGLLRSPHSPERLVLLNQGIDRAYRALDRRDWELNTVSLHRTDYVFEAGDESGLVDLPTRLEGVEGYIYGVSEFLSVWGQVSLTSVAVADAGPDRLLNWAVFQLRGSGSGVALEQPIAVVYTWRDGWVVRQQYWFDREAGTRAAGVDPAALESQLQ